MGPLRGGRGYSSAVDTLTLTTYTSESLEHINGPVLIGSFDCWDCPISM